MNKREAAVLGAYTGILMGEFSDMHEYVEKIMGRPVFTHEMGTEKIREQIQDKAKPDFLEICTNLTEVKDGKG